MASGGDDVRVLVQWSLAVPRGWDEVDASEWALLPYLAEPSGGERLTQKRGWPLAVNIQGVVFFGFDHIAVAPLGVDGCEAWGWNDDLDDDETRYRWGVHWTFLPPAFDDAVGQVNTRQTMQHYADDPADFASQVGAEVMVVPWSSFPAPPVDAVRHGVWVPDDLFAEHQACQDVRGWREWV